MRLIDADALSESIRNRSGTAIQKFFADACVAGAKTVEDVAQVAHAAWMIDEFGRSCSACEEYIDDDARPSEYCPNCGAKMDLE